MSEKVKSNAHLLEAQKINFYSNIDQLNDNVSVIFKSVHMNQSERNILTFLAQKSLEHIGCSWYKVKNIAKQINKSARMVGYALSSLESKGIISRKAVMRSKSGGNSSNVIVILPATKYLFQNCRPQIADRHNLSNNDNSNQEQSKSDVESVPLESLKQEKYKRVDDDRLYQLFKYKIQDKSVQYGSSYLEKVMNTVLKEYEDIERRQEYSQIQRTKEELPQYPAVNWLDSPIEDTNTPEQSPKAPEHHFSPQHCDDFWEMFG
ncbi:hypothetical protein [Salibacterium qingdaonense]|uniref:Helix-turn-helix domain-containing protein n=1 Tax=Salibacterium qingdaonense TaxID=266892 RepID=A0A1I4QM44_9BACI|nr:hypothetical protein [Salibacterium qingdaonense]SFM41084.1 hypothetical protein SAMN04488054_1456 [Salibacterium qingdaonense]